MTDDKSPPSQQIKGLPDPIGEAPWSADFVMQAIEVLPVKLKEDQIVSLSPNHSDSFVIAWPAGARPEDITMEALSRLGLSPIVVHSTSWRSLGNEVVLTYLAVVAPDSPVPPHWNEAPIKRSELARGGVTAPPPDIAVSQVIEHALRHLSWLVKDDPVIGEAISDWTPMLSAYSPEPFRALGQ